MIIEVQENSDKQEFYLIKFNQIFSGIFTLHSVQNLTNYFINYFDKADLFV